MMFTILYFVRRAVGFHFDDIYTCAMAIYIGNVKMHNYSY